MGRGVEGHEGQLKINPAQAQRSAARLPGTATNPQRMPNMEEQQVLIEKRERVLWITINRPARRNALTPTVLEELFKAMQQIHSDTDLLAAVITGTGDKAFCAGADLEPGKTFARDYSKPSTIIADVFRLARSAPIPLIARVNGARLAGGIGLMAVCGMAVATDDAIFGLQVFSALQPLVPRRQLYEWCVTGEAFDARTAKEAGLINYVVPRAELDAKVDQLLARITDKSPAAMRRGIYAMRQADAMHFEQSLAYMESQLGTISLTGDAKEGLAAFAEKRKPVWKGR